jgi:hypothetical protein
MIGNDPISKAGIEDLKSIPEFQKSAFYRRLNFVMIIHRKP